jgi:hypothetical protein
VKKAPTRATARTGARRRLEIGTDVQTSYFFMLNCLLHSRIHTGIESNTDVYDEDVNVYLAHLLNSQIDPANIERAGRYIAASDDELFRLAESALSDRERYLIYKTNADYLLLSIAVFDTVDRGHTHLPAVLHTPRQVFIARAATYYAQAASYACKLHRSPNGVARVLQKLSDGFENYVRILAYMRGQYLGLLTRYSPGELFHLDRQIDEIRRGETIEQIRNEFLEAYSAWMKPKAGRKRDELREELLRHAQRLSEIDPTFDFRLPA